MPWLDNLLLKSSDPRRRCKAVEHLSGSKDPSDTERIIATLQDESPQVRCAAVRALGKAPKPDSENSLIGALQDSHFQVREAAARALGQLNAVGSAGALAASLRDPDAVVRIAAASALRQMGWKPSTAEELAWFDIALGNIPPAEAPAELPETDPNQDTSFYRHLAAETLKERNDPATVNALFAALRSHDSLARVSAVHDLAQINRARITDELLKLFRDPDPEVRLAAAQALSNRDGSPPAHFVGLLQDEYADVRLAAVEFLGRIRHAQLAEVLSPLLSDAKLAVRQAAANALAFIGNRSSLEDLIVSLADEDYHMRDTVERALQELDPAWLATEAALKARVRLEALLSASSPSAAAVIQQVLDRLPRPSPETADGLTLSS